MVKRAISLFKSFCSRVECFLLPVLPYFRCPVHDREARLLHSTLNGGHILTELKFKGIQIFVKNKRSLTIAVAVTF